MNKWIINQSINKGVEPPQNIDPPNFLNNNLIMSQHSKQI